MFEQHIAVNGRVFWDVSGTHTTPHISEAQVVEVGIDSLVVCRQRNWYRTSEGFRAEECPSEQPFQIRRSYFEVPLTRRINETSDFWRELATNRS